MSKEEEYATHLPILKDIYTLAKFKNIFEFGCGNYSTKFFLEVCDKLTSIENFDKSWYDKIKQEIVSDKFTILYSAGTSAIGHLKDDDQYDLIFVDSGHRQACMNASFGHAPIIIVHDLGLRRIKRGFVNDKNKCAGYKMFTNLKYCPATSVFLKDASLIEQLAKNPDYRQIPL